MTVLAITNIKGGVGKTTAAVNLAWLSAGERTPTLLWDLDPQGAASFTFRVRPQVQVGARGLLRDEEALAGAIKGTDFPGLDLLPADVSYRKLDALLLRWDGKGRGLARALRPLRESYARIVLDCPPGFSVLSENVFRAADVLIVPSLPTVLSLRALASLARHVADRRDRCPLVLPFLNLVDRRRLLHRVVADRVSAAAGPWLGASIPQSSLVEQMGVERAPVGVFAAGSPVAADFRRLWLQVVAALDAPGADDEARRAASRRLADEVDAWIREWDQGGEKSPESTAVGAPGSGTVQAPGTCGAAGDFAPRDIAAQAADAQHSAPRDIAARGERRVRFTLADEAEVAALLRALGPGAEASVCVERLEHAFDTADHSLQRAGCSLSLVEVGGRFAVVAAAHSTDAGAPASGAAVADVSNRGDLHATIDSQWAFEILAGRRSPLDVLSARVEPRSEPLLARVVAVVGSRPVLRVASVRGVRRRVGPLSIAHGATASPPLTLDIWRTDLPAGSVAQEVEVVFNARDAADGEPFLRGLFERAGLPWRAACNGVPAAST